MKSEMQISDKELELISRSLDEDLSELEKRRLNQKILSKEDGARTWCRFHAVSAVMRKQFPAQLDKGFSQRVMQEIEKDSSQDEAPVRTGLHRATSTFKQVAGLAVAASVAAVSVMSYQYLNQPATDGNSIITSESFAEPVQPNTANSVQNLAVEFTPANLSSEQQNSLAVPEVEENIYFQEINPYIQEHSGFGSQRNMTPYSIIELKEVQE